MKRVISLLIALGLMLNIAVSLEHEEVYTALDKDIVEGYESFGITPNSDDDGGVRG